MSKIQLIIILTMLMVIGLTINISADMPWPQEFPPPPSDTAVCPYQMIYLNANNVSTSSFYMLVCSSTPIKTGTGGHAVLGDIVQVYTGGSQVRWYKLSGSPGNFYWESGIYEQYRGYFRQKSDIVWSTQAEIIDDYYNTVYWTQPAATYNNTMKVKTTEGHIETWEFSGIPTYGGVGTNSVKLYYTGMAKKNGAQAQQYNNELIRVDTFYNRNFDIKDTNGRKVLLLKKSAYIKLKSTSAPDTTGAFIDSWTSTVKVVFNSNNSGEDGLFNLENQYDKNMYQILQLYVQEGFIAFKTNNPDFYTITGNTIDSPVDSVDENIPVDPYIFEEELPDAAQYENTIYGKISFAVDKLAYYVSMPFRFILRMLGELVRFLSDTVTETANVVVMLTKMFAFLPVQIQTTIGGLFLVTSITTVYKVMRG